MPHGGQSDAYLHELRSGGYPWGCRLHLLEDGLLSAYPQMHQREEPEIARVEHSEPDD